MIDKPDEFLDRLLADQTFRARAAKELGLSSAAPIEGLSRPVSSAQAIDSNPEAPAQVSAAMAQAAVSYAFDLDSLRGNAGDRTWLLQQSRLEEVSGRKLLRLEDEERVRILNMADASQHLRPALAEHEEQDRSSIAAGSPGQDDLAGAYMRQMLRGQLRLGPEMLPAVHYRAIAQARAELDGVRDLASSIPDLAECRRRAGLAEIIGPLGVLIGVDQHNPNDRRDRFVGRTEELAVLRGTVDVLGSHSLLEAVNRSVTRNLRAATGRDTPRLIAISARGGLGKTALMAKFLYDHATMSASRLPFAFLDFDRSDLQPRSPALLLLEVCRQVGLQHAYAQPELDQLTEEVKQSLIGKSTATIVQWCARFIGIVRRTLSASHASTFLLVFDTLEVVDADPEAMKGLVEFLTMLTNDPWPELCVVAAGRSGLDTLTDPEALTFSVTRIDLGPLSLRDAAEMVKQIGERLLGARWGADWAKKIAGGSRDSPTRREPLTLRLAVEIVRNTPEDRRAAVVEDIRRQGENADEAFIGALYERRILDHVRDPNARKLAWPGLIARRITRVMAREVLAPICDLTATEAEAAFASLANEGWIVDREQGGTVLRHRRDLRSRTLPLMRRRDPEQFSKVVNALIDYYRKMAPPEPEEEAYYLLLRGRKSDVFERDFDPDILAALSADRFDFEPGSPGWSLLESRFGDRLLECEQLQQLPDVLLWKHVARTGSSLRGMNDRRIEPRTRMLAGKPPPGELMDSPAVQTAWQSVQIKTGQWRQLDPDRLTLPVSQNDLTQFAFFIAKLSLAGIRQPDFWVRAYPDIARQINDARGRDNWRALAFALTVASQYDSELANQIDMRTSYALETSGLGQGRTREGALKQLLLFGQESRMPAMAAWCRLEAERISGGMSFVELALLLEAAEPATETAAYNQVQEFLELTDKQRAALDTRSYENLPRIIVQDRAVLWAAGELLSNLDRQMEHSQVEQFARRYFFVREPEWIGPLSYLLDRALPSSWRERLNREFSAARYDAPPNLLSRVTRAIRSPRLLTDLIALMTWADRAGDIEGLLAVLAGQLDGSARADFNYLNDIRIRSRGAMKNLTAT